MAFTTILSVQISFRRKPEILTSFTYSTILCLTFIYRSIDFTDHVQYTHKSKRKTIEMKIKLTSPKHSRIILQFEKSNLCLINFAISFSITVATSYSIDFYPSTLNERKNELLHDHFVPNKK